MICGVVICGVDEVGLEGLNLASNAFTLTLKLVLIIVITSISCVSYARITVLSESSDCSAIFWPLIFPAIFWNIDRPIERIDLDDILSKGTRWLRVYIRAGLKR